jgi:two-component system, NarL family, nitrate/nitrite response regulator NarL
MNKVNIIIADDHKLFINGLQLLIKNEGWIEIIDIAYDGKELLSILHKKVPDIILLDINMPILNGFSAVHHIRQSFPLMKIIFLSTYNELHLIEKAKSLGVNGYLLKNSNKEELFQAIQLVASGHTCFPYSLRKDTNEFDAADDFLKQFNITKRELEILGLIKTNITNQQIANKLFLSIYTVETHRKNIMQKLGLNTPGGLMKFIIENNI